LGFRFRAPWWVNAREGCESKGGEEKGDEEEETVEQEREGQGGETKEVTGQDGAVVDGRAEASGDVMRPGPGLGTYTGTLKGAPRVFQVEVCLRRIVRTAGWPEHQQQQRRREQNMSEMQGKQANPRLASTTMPCPGLVVGAASPAAGCRCCTFVHPFPSGRPSSVGPHASHPIPSHPIPCVRSLIAPCRARLNFSSAGDSVRERRPKGVHGTAVAGGCAPG